MDLRGLDSQWRGFSDFDIKKAKRESDHQQSGEAPPPSSSPPPTRQKVSPSQSSLHENLAPSTTNTGSPTSGQVDKPIADETTPLKPEMPTQQSEKLTQQSDMPTQQSEMPTQQVDVPPEADLQDNLSPAQKALQQKQQQDIEEANKKKQKLVEKTLKERYSLTQQESERLKKVHEELASLDKLVTRDVTILRDKIEAANTLHNQARLRYEQAEREFVSAKLELHRTKEEKELLSEHLCAIIHQTELRKAKKLNQLCQTLGVDDHSSSQTVSANQT